LPFGVVWSALVILGYRVTPGSLGISLAGVLLSTLAMFVLAWGGCVLWNVIAVRIRRNSN
jgi:hypothetical protein